MRRITRSAIYTLLVFAAVIFTLTQYKLKTFGNLGLDELSFYLANGVEGANTGTFTTEALQYAPLFVFTLALLVLPVIDLYKNRVDIAVSFWSKQRRVNLSRVITRLALPYALVVFLVISAYGLWSIDAYNYIRTKNQTSAFFEENYVDPRTVDLIFPEQKRNLIYIFLESTENTLMSRDAGGVMERSLQPELEHFALDPKNISFSNTSTLGGPLPLAGTTWTVGAMISQSAGLPLLTTSRIDGNEFGNLNKLVPGAYSLGEVLEGQGYNQQLLIGSLGSFGGRDKYYKQHGNYDIFDITTAKEQGKLPLDYQVWWGYEDKKLMEYAKEQMTNLASRPEPFNFQMLTVDTHHTDGYLDETCPQVYARQYDSVHACSSRLVGEIITWIQSQDFYKKTTVVVVGDHLGMQHAYYDELIGGQPYQRTTYNAILNSAITDTTHTKNRLFSSVDMYPTTLASMGVTIEGDKLGVGVNLFSGKKTIIEEHGFDYVNVELSKKSPFYYDNILTTKIPAKQ